MISVPIGWRRLTLAALATITLGCDDASTPLQPARDAGHAGADAATHDAVASDAGISDGGAPAIVPFPGGCTRDDDCGAARCFAGICVPEPPPVPSEYSCEDAPAPGSTPNLTCWDTPPSLAEGPATVPGRGLVEYFGEGDKTLDLRLRFYDFATFDPSPCVGVGARERDVRAARAAVERCLDETLDAVAASAPVADVTTVECDPPQADSACWSADALPTGRPLVARVTGAPEAWVPTYQYGLLINPCLTEHPRFDSGICPETLTDQVQATNWSCGLVDAPSPFHAAVDGAYWFRNISVISQETWDSFPQTAGEVRINLGLGAVAGRQYDCDGRSVINATFGLANPGARDTYFNGIAADTLPSPGRASTNLLGTYANLNTPPGPNGFAAVAWVNDTLTLVNYERFFLLPDTVTIVNPTGRSAVRVEPPY